MKYILTILISLYGLVLFGRESSAQDTIFIISNPENVELIESGKGISLTLKKDSVITYNYHHNNPDNVSSFYHKEDRSSLINHSTQVMRHGSINWEVVTGGFCFGPVSGLGCPDEMKVKPWKSWEIAWLYMVGLRVRNYRNSLTIGLGMTWRNYSITSGQFIKDNGSISLAPFPENTYDNSSRLKIVSLNVPVFYEVRLAKHVGLTLGPILNFTTHSSLKTKYSYDGNKTTLTSNDISARRFTIDILGSVRYRDIGIYTRYAPMHALQTACGPRFSSISAGLILFL